MMSFSRTECPDQAVFQKPACNAAVFVLTVFLATSPIQGEASPIAAGDAHSMVVRADGTVWTWGSNTYGQLGDGSAGGRATPAIAKNLTKIVALAAGNYHSLALDADGAVWTWGYNAYGQLGDGSGGNRPTPYRITNLPAKITAIAAGSFHSLALAENGQVWSWGANYAGQLGNGGQGGGGCGITFSCVTLPTPVSDIFDVVSVDAKGNQSFAVTRDGRVWAWGENRSGQLGDGTLSNRNTPVRLEQSNSIASIAAGEFHTLQRSTSGAVSGWGNSQVGQLTTFATTLSTQPKAFTSVPQSTQIASGAAFSLSLDAGSGSVRAWGSNDYGQLGDGTRSNKATPVTVFLPNPASRIAAGRHHVLAIDTSNNVWAWGRNDSGQTGSGLYAASTIPLQVTAPTSETGQTTLNLAIPLPPVPEDNTADEACFFAWAEARYAEHFAPAEQTTQTFPPYHYRYYPETNKFLWRNTTDGNVYVLFPDETPNLVEVGKYTSFVAVAKATGCK